MLFEVLKTRWRDREEMKRIRREEEEAQRRYDLNLELEKQMSTIDNAMERLKAVEDSAVEAREC